MHANETRKTKMKTSKVQPATIEEGIKAEKVRNVGVGSLIRVRRSGYEWWTLFGTVIFLAWAVYYYQYENLPPALSSTYQVGHGGFSEAEALKHIKVLTDLGPHSVGSDALDNALQYVLKTAEEINKTASPDVNVEVDFFHAKSGTNRMESGLFKEKTLAYSDLKHVVVRILPKYTTVSASASDEAEDNAILVSAHVDTVFAAPGAGDDSSNVAVMLELARGLSQSAQGFKNAVIFLFNTGEEEGLNGAHSFITQHPWSSTVKVAVDLEAMGLGGKSGIFQAGPDTWAIENFASAAKYPSGNIVSQDLFSSGAIKSSTDFQVYREVAGLSGLDFAYTDNGAVYHTKNDRLELLKTGSLQHLGENMLAFLIQGASSSDLPKVKGMHKKGNAGDDTAIYFDILGSFMILYKQRFASTLYNSVIMQSLVILAASLVMGGYPAVISLGLSCLSIILMSLFAIIFSVLVAFILPQISSSPVPYVASPWLVIGLFAAPALLGALTGQHLGYLILQTYLSTVYSKRPQLSFVMQSDLSKLEAERWLFKAGFVQWLIILIVGNYYKLGSTYIALFWLVPPALAYGFLEATLNPARLPTPLKLETLLIGMAVPILISAGTFIRLPSTSIGNLVQFEGNPGSNPEWLGSVTVSVSIAVVLCLSLVYILSCVHLSGAKSSIILATSVLLGASLFFISSGIIPPFTEDTSRAVNIVHVVEQSSMYGENQYPTSYVSLFSTTSGKLTKEVEEIDEGFECGGDKVVDFVTFSVKYSCWTYDDTKLGWSDSDIHTLHVVSDTKGHGRITKVSIDTKASTRWALAINTEEVEDFILKGNTSEEFVPSGNMTSVDGWHIVQFSGGKDAPRKFELTLFWVGKPMQSADNVDDQIKDQRPLLKLRTDVDKLTPKTKRVLDKLPAWCSLYGKSTSPKTLAFLSSLPVSF